MLPAILRSNIKFTNMTSDSRRVKQGSLFVAYPGEHQDGRDFIEEAIGKGAAAVLWEKQNFSWKSSKEVANDGVLNLKLQVGEFASKFYGDPSTHLWVIGVTGTNGKTTCTHWLAQAFSYLSKKTAVIGTIGNGVLSANKPLGNAVNTTPDSILLHAMMAEYVEQEVNVVAMEVSSHGLDQGRVSGVDFDIALLTNLTRDHLDYHGDMAAYAAAKKKLFAWETLKCAVVNVDDAFGQSIASEFKAAHKNVMTYALNQPADIVAKDIKMDAQGISMEVHTQAGSARLSSDVIGHFNVYNLLGVLGVLLASGVDLHEAIEALSKVKSVAGRMQQYGGKTRPLVVVDYAHTPDALEQVLKSLRPQTKGKLICVFGCGGDRDKGKRPLMTKIASELADQIILTSDNPRAEPLENIIHDMLQGSSLQHKVINDRAHAICFAIQQATSQDLVLVAGKGHETYQEIAGVKHPFSDIEVIEKALEELAA